MALVAVEDHLFTVTVDEGFNFLAWPNIEAAYPGAQPSQIADYPASGPGAVYIKIVNGVTTNTYNFDIQEDHPVVGPRYSWGGPPGLPGIATLQASGSVDAPRYLIGVVPFNVGDEFYLGYEYDDSSTSELDVNEKDLPREVAIVSSDKNVTKSIRVIYDDTEEARKIVDAIQRAKEVLIEQI